MYVCGCCFRMHVGVSFSAYGVLCRLHIFFFEGVVMEVAVADGYCVRVYVVVLCRLQAVFVS